MSDTTFKETTTPDQVDKIVGKRPGFSAFVFRQLISRFDYGALTVILPNGRRLGVRGAAEGPVGIFILHRWRVLRRLLQGGDIGFAEAYLDGDWSSPDLTALIEVLARNRASVPGVDGENVFSRIVNRLLHLSRANSLTGSKRNIVQHYDLGNDFYARWLDEGMSYSSALFDSPDGGLEAAQTAKQDRVLQLLGLQTGQSALEIGIGWGGMAERVVRAGGRLTGVTLSPAQLGYARARFAGAGMDADLRLQDYRQIEGRFDRIVSIEMLEAVGEAWWPVYFDKLRALLAEGGRIVLQTITISDDRFTAYRRNVDFIQRYIFPGGMLPAPAKLRQQIERAGLRVEMVETFGGSYARTLDIWHERFQAAWPSIAAMGFRPRFKRMWDYYLAYCEAGFRSGAIDVGLWRLGHRR
ncbi:cyclopropane-fatty-acyl-phospholipid synthase family protein [Acidisphaera sp. S103]|uniref:SAM-dependent methyltransferase n=1 Tax=Acidisphaera sp. S103 TaxID=1747223 RepID=UPI00131B02F3|nr:cyclopropane-fatty-acyl-phospholipid synthase family protein [Acidisphaera sp. S103]